MQTDEKTSKLQEIYTSGLYLKNHPEWHVEESPWKAQQILRMLERQNLKPQMVCEVGCGAGEILRQLQAQMDPQSSFWGYDISPQAIAMAKTRENERLHFKVADILREQDVDFDLLMLMDVLEHIEDRYGFLRELKKKADYKLFHSSLTISLQTVLRPDGLSNVRETYGMVNYFTKETLLQTLKDADYEIIDCFYTTSCTDLPTHVLSKKLMKLPRRLLFGLNQDLAARILGGYRLLVLAK
jgi:2-polyprenyl-3-methyl-5-hydroxy-6-metoxy-1,4-benzoquinol methylase